MAQGVKAFLSVLLSISLVLVSFSAIVAQGAQDACTQAKMDAQADTNKTMWMLGGCLFGLLGVGAAYVLEPSPPASRLVGKPSEYVAYYTDCYRDEAKRIRTKGAWLGCVVGSVLSVAWYVVLVAAAASESD